MAIATGALFTQCPVQLGVANLGASEDTGRRTESEHCSLLNGGGTVVGESDEINDDNDFNDADERVLIGTDLQGAAVAAVSHDGHWWPTPPPMRPNT